MPQSFVNITQEFAQLCETHILLTPNERLAREYHFAYDNFQRARGLTGWHTLRCYSLSRFLQMEFRRAQDEYEPAAELISSPALLNLIVQHAPVESTQLAQTFARAWQTVHRYDLDVNATEFQSTRGDFFRTWYQQVDGSLPADALLEECIGDLLCELNLVPSAPLVLTDFEALTAVEKRYLEHVAGHVEVQQVSVAPRARSDKSGPPALYGFASLQDEVAAAAAWAYQLKAATPDASIGIVVPNLAQHYELVQRQCAAILDPAAGSLSDVFDLSAGTSLCEQPVWRHAHRLLKAVTAGIDPESSAFFSHSRFFALHGLRDIAQNWPRRLPRTVTVRQLQNWLSDSALTPLATCIDNLATTGSFAYWVDVVRELLSTVGWPQVTDLNSNQYQAVQAIQQAFDQFQSETGEFAQRHMDFSAAVRLLDVCLQQKLFAPQRPHSDILVLGLLETTGLSFSHLWVCGLDENNFPGRSVANPFIPRAVALRHGVPRSTQADELIFARTQLHNWQNNSDLLCCSFSHSADDNEQQPSPLLQDLCINTPDAPMHPYFVEHKQALLSYVDTRGTPVASHGLGGGTGVLGDQAACPFKAYAQYRLGLKRPVEVADFPNALVRGNLLHDTLFDLLRRHSTQETLRNVTSATVEETCQRTLDEYPLRFPQMFVEREINRLTRLILEWLVLEAARQPFEAVYLEETFTLDLDGLQFRIRVDRIDRIDEQLVVIDYKTGKVSLSGVTKTPTADPQLPAYSLIDDNIAGVYYGEVRNDPRLIGIAQESASIEGSKLKSTRYAWPEQRRQWRSELEQLARAFAHGQAIVDPQPGACTYCHLKSLCRVEAV